MDPAEEKFFESLARSGPSAKSKRKAEPQQDPDSEADIAAEEPAEDLKTDAQREVPAATEAEGQLTLDVYQTADALVVESAIAGVKPENIDIDVTSDSIAIRGERRREHQVKEEDYFYQECYWGRFSRSVILPQEVDPENASVSFKNGVLTVHLPKMNRKKSKKLKVKFE